MPIADDVRACLWLFMFTRAVFWSLLGVSYLFMGMQEVYRILFHIFRLDPEAEICKPSPRHRYIDEDNVFPEFEKNKMNWQNIFTFHVGVLIKILVFIFVIGITLVTNFKGCSQ